MLNAIDGKMPDGTVDQVAEPLIDLLDTTLLTNANGEPRIGSQIISEIPSAERIDVIMAFIRKSGINPMLDALRFHCESGRSLRVLTTTYTGSTEASALDLLVNLGAQIKVSYDEKTPDYTPRPGYSNATPASQLHSLALPTLHIQRK